MNLKKTPLLLSFLSMCLLTFCFCTTGEDDETIKNIIKNVRRTLTFLHYQPQRIDDEFSEKVFAEYFKQVDPSKQFYMQSDMDLFKRDIDKLDDYFANEDLRFYHSTIDTLYSRYDLVEGMVEDILSKPFDFNKREDLVVDVEKRPWAKNQEELYDLWRRSLKYSILEQLVSEDLNKDSDNEDADEPKKDTVQLTFAEREQKAREEYLEDMRDFFRRRKKRKKFDFLDPYLNAFTSIYDPHTTYFLPKGKEDFDFQMSGQLEGIGARLQDKKGYATIVELVIGGPAWKSNELEVGDQIIKVGQGKKDPVNIVGMLLDESIRLIRGKKGTEVRLTVKKKDGIIDEVVLIRDRIEYNEVFARSAVIENDEGKKYGIIYLPEFYINFNDKDSGRDASDDILNQINALKQENVEGIVFDLRNNGGGSLQEVVEIAGHFIPKGPIVQAKRSDGKHSILEDTDETISYHGNLVILVNETSASASEIFAAAMQDYERGVVVGSPRTYGKGTVQSLYPLDRSSFSSDKYGAIKLTVQKYYRITGGSVQRKGVNSDIVIPDQYTYSDYFEDNNEYALPWDKIQPLEFTPWEKAVNYDKIKSFSHDRLKNNEMITLLDESAKYIRKRQDVEKISLNYDDYVAYRKNIESEIERFEVLEEFENGLEVKATQMEFPEIEKDTVLKAKRERWFDNLEKDMYLVEALSVLDDLNK